VPLPAQRKEIVLFGIKRVAAETDLKPWHIYKLIRQGKFARPLKVGRRSLWTADDIADLQHRLLAERDAKAGA
jgi:predicted DNA-binding transcriptional regulator AlpA